MLVMGGVEDPGDGEFDEIDDGAIVLYVLQLADNMILCATK